MGNTRQCDGLPDCVDGSDEMECPVPVAPANIQGGGNMGGAGGASWPSLSCRPEEFACETSRQCILKERQCDEYPDCQYGEDEANCQLTQVPKSDTCRLNEFECEPNVCIHETWVCDGRPDCRDGKDEATCGLCRDTEFTCLSGECVDRRFLCDEVPDCEDGSDEAVNTCRLKHTCPTGHFMCDKNRCLPDDRICNSYIDCEDQTDEFNCRAIKRCAFDQFQCDNGECIPGPYECDNFN